MYFHTDAQHATASVHHRADAHDHWQPCIHRSFIVLKGGIWQLRTSPCETSKRSKELTSDVKAELFVPCSSC